ncbi:hypothetical protein R6Q57_005578 [Mikania cordata]
MEGGSSRGGSSTKKFRKPRPKNVQTAQINSFNTPGYRPQMSSPNQPIFYYDPMNLAQYLQYSPGTQQQFNRWEQSYNTINKVTNNSINKLFNNNLHFKTIVIIIKMTRIQVNIIKLFKSSRNKKKKNRLGERERNQWERKHRPSVGPIKKRLRWPDLG